MRKLLLFLSVIFLLLALTPFTAEADFRSGIRDQQYYGPPISVWDDMGGYSNPYPFGYWYGVDNMSGYNNPFGDWYGMGDYYNPYPFGYWYGVNNMSNYNNPFGTWTGVNNMTNYNVNNPFGTWSGVNNLSTDYNPFGTWTGVNNLGNDYNPFGTWSGVNNMGQNYESEFFGQWYGVRNTDEFINNPMGTWTGVNNMDRDYNPFGTWTGVNNLGNDYNPFGTWSGVNNMESQSFAQNPSGFDANGYQTSGRPRVKSYQSQISYQEYPTVAQTSGTNFVAPRTGASTLTALVFAGLLTAISAVIFKRKQIINFIRE